MTTRYSGRIERFASSPGSAREPMEYADLFQKRAEGSGSRPTPAETLARLLDTHSWLKVRKDA